MPELWTLGGFGFMTGLRKQKLGLILIATAVGCMIVYYFVVITHSSNIGTPRIVGSGHAGSVGWMVTEQKIETNFSPVYLIPIGLCGAAGLLLLLWPTRKPPKLPG